MSEEIRRFRWCLPPITGLILLLVLKACVAYNTLRFQCWWAQILLWQKIFLTHFVMTAPRRGEINHLNGRRGQMTLHLKGQPFHFHLFQLIQRKGVVKLMTSQHEGSCFYLWTDFFSYFWDKESFFLSITFRFWSYKRNKYNSILLLYSDCTTAIFTSTCVQNFSLQSG